VREMSIDKNYGGDITPIRSELSKFSRGTDTGDAQITVQRYRRVVGDRDEALRTGMWRGGLGVCAAIAKDIRPLRKIKSDLGRNLLRYSLQITAFKPSSCKVG
jgi:hypothetical protein